MCKYISIYAVYCDAGRVSATDSTTVTHKLYSEQLESNLSRCNLRFAGNMDRTAAKNVLMSRSDGTFLVRQKDGGEFAISIK